MKITVQQTSGDTDEWEGELRAAVDIDLIVGALVIVSAEHENAEATAIYGLAEAVYAPGMWMKFEVDRES